MVILGGNMRFRAMKEAKWKEVPVEVVDWSEEKQREFIIKDNVGFGEWDWENLANEWDAEQLADWGLEVPGFDLSKKTESEETQKKQVFSFRPVYKSLKTRGIEYFCLFRNNDMDLEDLKSKKQNADIFVFPLVKYIKENKISKIAVAPHGKRAEINGFHFASYILQQALQFVEFQIETPFKNKNNKIEKTKDCKDCIIFDDIVTRGNTIKKMVELLGSSEVLILLTNH
jgi:phosphoribosylpyrophosphate synthetase